MCPGPVVKNSVHQGRKLGLDLWVGKMPWKRTWHPTPVLLPGKSHRQRSLEGYSPWGHKRVRHHLATKQQQWVRYVPHTEISTLRVSALEGQWENECVHDHHVRSEEMKAVAKV